MCALSLLCVQHYVLQQFFTSLLLQCDHIGGSECLNDMPEVTHIVEYGSDIPVQVHLITKYRYIPLCPIYAPFFCSPLPPTTSSKPDS